MKISKLFHWLYAILMLLPFAFFVPSVLYYAFNDNSTMQTVEVPKTETIAVDFNQKYDLYNNTYGVVNGVTFTKQSHGVLVNGTADANIYFGYRVSNFVDGHVYLLKNSNTYFDSNFYLYGTDNLSNLNVKYVIASSVTFTFTSINGNTDYRYYIAVMNGKSVSNVYVEPQIYDLTQMFGVGKEPTIEQFNRYFPNSYYPYTESDLMQITYNTGETEEIISNTDIINYAWESIWDLPLFNWCKVSFVSVPFTYITGLFGLAASNSFNYVFTYFASMSIIWLVFDVIMYVPLLVHRWIDKGIVE